MPDYFEMAMLGALPEGFDQWGLANERGLTVAHWAAIFCHLPEGFSQWGLADNDGTTVADVAAWRVQEIGGPHDGRRA